MAQILRAHVVGQFPVDATGDDAYPVSIEPDTAVLEGLKRPLLVFPSTGVTLATDAGYVEAAGTKAVNVPQGMLIFSGAGAQSLPKRPYDGLPEFKVLFAFSSETGAAISASVSFDPHLNRVTLTPECHAAVSYSAYTSRAMIALYTPKQVSALPSFFHYGIVAAFRAPSTLVTHQVESLDEFGAVDIELYRIVSQSVTTPDGAFEKPPDWPTSGAYPGKSFVLDADSYVQIERVHEIGGMTRTGIPFVRTYSVPKLDPYIGDTSYTITTECRTSDLGDSYPRALVLAAKSFIASRNLGCQ